MLSNQPKAYTVTAITRRIKGTLEESFSDIWVEGEISNYHHHSSGHRYLSLKDEGAVLRVVMWRSIAAYLRFEPEDGQKVLAFGDITVYEKGGQYQLNCRKLVPVGMGELELAYRQLYERLSNEGLFDSERKKPLPEYANRVGIVTSPTGAAIREIIQIARRRNPYVELIIYPAQVQGDGAEETIAEGIRYFNTRGDVDVIVIGRGGGSLEDLWPFNTELLVRAVATSRIPIVSAVGHEVDTVLTDYAADKRVPTPSAASEQVVWSMREYQETVRGHIVHQTSILRGLLSSARRHFEALMKRPVLVRPQEMLQQRQQYCDHLSRMLMSSGKNSFERHKNRLSLIVSRLDALSPLKILSRGYSVARLLPNKGVIKSIADVNVGDRHETILADGMLVSSVESKKKDGSP